MSSKVFLSATCPSCSRAAGSPFRQYATDGHVVAGCVDHFHTGHLQTCSASTSWHARPEAKKIRATLRAGRNGYVTESISHI